MGGNWRLPLTNWTPLLPGIGIRSKQLQIFPFIGRQHFLQCLSAAYLLSTGCSGQLGLDRDRGGSRRRTWAQRQTRFMETGSRFLFLPLVVVLGVLCKTNVALLQHFWIICYSVLHTRVPGQDVLCFPPVMVLFIAPTNTDRVGRLSVHGWSWQGVPIIITVACDDHHRSIASSLKALSLSLLAGSLLVAVGGRPKAGPGSFLASFFPRPQ